MPNNTMRRWVRGISSVGGTAVYFIMALEIMIMISPFAFFFYAVFNPILHFFGEYSATRWLTGFFLPHMIYPPGIFLQGIRILGSILFLLGLVLFLICALQVYLGKILKLGLATRGLYGIIRHPQYLGLAICGAGMAILWPRFLVLATLSLMLILYYFLARDEERRMINAYEDDYRNYMERTGMFLPVRIERPVVSIVLLNNILKPYQSVVFPLATVALLLFLGFSLRALTLAQLPVQINGNLALVSMLPEDNISLEKLSDWLHSPEKNFYNNSLPDQNEKYLGYIMPVDYIMQGMIANTGEHSQLYKQHHTLSMISDWILHPFRHLREPAMHMAHQMPAGHDMSMARRHMCPLGIDDPGLECSHCPYRRVILVKVGSGKNLRSDKNFFALNARREAAGYLDIDLRSGKIINSAKVPGKTAWEDVPTPIF